MAFSGNLGDLSIAINADMKGLTNSLAKARAKMMSFGKTMSLAVTAPLVALGVKSVKAFGEQEKALAKVRSGLASTGNAANKTLGQLAKQASELQKTSLFGDEEILDGVTAQLLTFTNIAGKQFDRTQQAAVDLAAKLGGDLQSSTIMLGKALNDPVANLGALSRAGIQFSKSQKEVIKGLVESGDLAKAQTIILDELEKQYGGTAEAIARAGTGPITQMKNALGDVTEIIGGQLTPLLIPIADAIRRAAESFQSMDIGMQRMVVGIAAVIAAIGPLVMAFSLLLALVTPFSIMMTGIITALAAVSAAFVLFKDQIVMIFEALKTLISNAANYIVLSLTNMALRMVEALTPLSWVLKKVGVDIAELRETLQWAADAASVEMANSMDDLGSSLEEVQGKFANLSSSIQDFKYQQAELPSAINETTQAIKEQGTETDKTVKKVSSGFSSLFEQLGSALGSGGDISSILGQFAGKAIGSIFDNIIGSVGGGSSGGSLFGGFFASGGRPPQGIPSMVGENGPELFVPDTAGTIISNDALGAGGGGSVVINQNFALGVQDTVRAELLSMRGQLKADAVSAVQEATNRGGRVARNIRGK